MPQTDLKKAKERAKKLGVQVKESTKKNKKLDVYKDGERVASIGDIHYSDYLQHEDSDRRRRYKQRHETHRHKVGTASYYADRILW